VIYLQDDLNLIDTKSSSWSKNDGIRYLIELGFSRIQANLYLNLIKYGETDARILASCANLPRTEVYRTLNELQEKGLVDRELGSPLKFSAVPPLIGLQALIDRKNEEINRMQSGLDAFSKEFKVKEEKEKENEYKITIIEGRKRIVAQIKKQHNAAKSTVNIVSFLPRFVYVANEVLDNYKKAVERGVKYRIVIGLPNKNEIIPDDIIKIYTNKNTEIKTIVGARKVNSAIFDQEQASFSYYPDRPITESPYVLTNHPCLVEFALNSFDQTWNSL
jgi:sugar-specific transcriptional regulator TrmB